MLNQQMRKPLNVAVAFFLVCASVSIVRLFAPLGVDWQFAYYPALRNLRQPYDTSSFAGIPWLLAVLPHAVLPLEWGNAINIVLHIVVLVAIVRVYQGNWVALILVFTSPIFLDLMRTNNADWVPALAFLLPTTWGLPLLAAKPQTLGGAALIWWKREGYSVKILLPMFVLVALSFVLWPTWVVDMGGRDSSIRDALWNFAPWPFGIPLGAYLLYRGYRADDEVLAAAATPFLVPYFAPYSLTPLFALLACRYRTIAVYIYFTLWFYLIIESRRIAGM